MDSLSYVVDALCCLPGVGPKSAQRMVLYLLQHQRQRGLKLAECLQDAMQNVGNCKVCNDFTVNETCKICQDPARDQQQICVVESPTDIIAIEQTAHFKGRYFVLMGKISPIDGIGPNDIGLDKLAKLLTTANAKEVIIALTPSVEGQTTLHYIQDMLHDSEIKISQIAHGIPTGSELNFLDSNTISSALRNRETITA